MGELPCQICKMFLSFPKVAVTRREPILGSECGNDHIITGVLVLDFCDKNIRINQLEGRKD